MIGQINTSHQTYFTIFLLPTMQGALLTSAHTINITIMIHFISYKVKDKKR